MDRIAGCLVLSAELDLTCWHEIGWTTPTVCIYRWSGLLLSFRYPCFSNDQSFASPSMCYLLEVEMFCA
jgi:hypothetical protein